MDVGSLTSLSWLVVLCRSLSHVVGVRFGRGGRASHLSSSLSLATLKDSINTGNNSLVVLSVGIVELDLAGIGTKASIGSDSWDVERHLRKDLRHLRDRLKGGSLLGEGNS